MKVESIYLAVGKTIAERRKEAGLTQERFARICGLSRASLANIECGLQNVYVHQLVSIADALGVGSIDELVSDSHSPKVVGFPKRGNFCTPDPLTPSELRQTMMIYSQSDLSNDAALSV